MKIGDRYNRWTVTTDRFKKDDSYNWYVVCVCDCGTVADVGTSKLTATKSPSKSCGCLQREVAASKRGKLPIGCKINRLTIKEDLGYSGRKRFCLADCECGSLNVKFRWDQVKSGHTKSCGCLQKLSAASLNETHGMSSSREHSIWTAMKQRCSNPKSSGYDMYGGRGISYDPKWESFEGFYEDMGDCPEGLSLDRKDPSGNYEKDNCRWADASIQVHNQRKRRGNTTSDYKGVYYDKAKKRWIARLYRGKVKLLLAGFSTEIEAARAYDDASEELYGDRPNNT